MKYTRERDRHEINKKERQTGNTQERQIDKT